MGKTDLIKSSFRSLTTQNNQENADLTKTCRICATVTEFVIPIFEEEGIQNNLAEKIHKHLPIQISINDELPHMVCYQCSSTLLAWHELVECCVQAEMSFRTKITVSAAQGAVNSMSNDQAPCTSSDSNDTQKKVTHQNQVDKNKLNFYKIVKSVLIDFQIIKEDTEFFDYNTVCQICNHTISTNIENLSSHFETEHVDVQSKEAVASFIEANMMFHQSHPDDDTYEQSEPLPSSPEHVAPNETNESHKPVNINYKLKEYYCPFCSCVFTSPTRLIFHMNSHAEIYTDAGFICTICKTTFSEKKVFVCHLQEKHVTPLDNYQDRRCRACGFLASDAGSLKVHISETHLLTDGRERANATNGTEETLECTECDEIFFNERTLARHARNHSNPNGESTTGGGVNQKRIPAKCPECSKQFSNKYNMAAHLSGHRARARYECGACGRRYRHLSSLRQHERAAHRGLLPAACALCGELFPSRAARERHARRHAAVPRAPHRAFRCRLCARAFRARDALRRHQDEHRARRARRDHACSLCAKAFKRRAHLDYHLKSHAKRGETAETGARRSDSPTESSEDIALSDDEPLASLAARRPSAAAALQNFYDALVDFRNHFAKEHNAESRSYPDFTDASESESVAEVAPPPPPAAGRDLDIDKFDDLSRDNMRVERSEEAPRRVSADGEARYECGECAARVRSRHALRLHARTHSGERPCVCEVCGARFTAPPGLRRHLAETHRRRRRRRCDLCAATFANSQNLKQHMRIHTGERPFVCSHCGKRFAQSGSLHVHLKTHSSVFPFACGECGAQFRVRAGLARHRLRHSGERPHACALCAAAFRLKHELTAHLAVHSAATAAAAAAEHTFACDACGALFRLERTLRHHRRRVHEGAAPTAPAPAPAGDCH